MLSFGKHTFLQVRQRLVIVALLVGIVTYTFLPFQSVSGQQTATVLLDPLLVNVLQGENHTLTINATSVSGLSSWQITIKYNGTIGNITGFWLPDENVFNFTEQQIIAGPDYFRDVKDGFECISFGATLFLDSINVTNGVLCKMNYTAFSDGDPSIVFATRPNRAHKTKNEYDAFYSQLLNVDQGEIPFTPKSGSKAMAALDVVPSVETRPGKLSITGHTPPGDAPYVHAFKDYSVMFNASKSYGIIVLENGTRVLSNDAIVSYIWDFGDGDKTTTGTPAIVHTYNKTGTFTARLEVVSKDDPPVTSEPIVTVMVVGIVLDKMDWSPFVYGVFGLAAIGIVFYVAKETRRYIRSRRETKKKRAEFGMVR